MTDQVDEPLPDEDEEDDCPEDSEFDIPEPEESEWEEGSSPYDDDDDESFQDVTDSGLAVVRSLATFVRSGEAAVRWALSQSSWQPPGMCQQFTRMTFNVGSGFPSAHDAWYGADHRHPETNPLKIPRGVPTYWLGGSRGFGHAAVSLGSGLVRSTDWPYSGRVGTARITDIWSNQRLVGWTEDINNVTVWEDPGPVLDASYIARCMCRRLAPPNGRVLKRAISAEVGEGKMNLRSKKLGGASREQYKLVQRKYLKSLHRVPTADAVDGIPGPASLEWLGRRHGFRVVL